MQNEKKTHKQNDKKAMTTSSVYFDATNGIESNALGHDADNAINSFQYTIKNVRSFSIQQLIPVQMHRLSHSLSSSIDCQFYGVQLFDFIVILFPARMFYSLSQTAVFNPKFESRVWKAQLAICVPNTCAKLEIQYNLRARNEKKKKIVK